MNAESFLDLCNRRCSVRHYRPDPVPRAVIDRCLEAARLAPSACNSQPWYFIVVTNPDLRRELAETAFGGIYSVFKFAASAPVLIALLSRRSKYAAALAGRLRGVQYNLVDIGIAGEHLALQAAAEGLGTCWLGWFNEKGVKKTLNLGRGERVDILFSLGYPLTAEPPVKTRKTMDEIRRYA